MHVVIISVNLILAGIVLFAGILYPSIKDWAYFATGLIGFFVILELAIAQLRLLDAAKISAWTVNALGTVLTVVLLLPHKLGWGDWWALLVGIIVGGAALTNVVIIILFRLDGIADLKPKTSNGGRDVAK